MNVYTKPTIEHDLKEGNFPVTEADLKANQIIVDALKESTPDIPILSEESKEVPYSERKDWSVFWLVDPLDGTKGFLQRNDEFTVNIALMVNGKPIAGVVHAPALGTTYYGQEGKGAFKLHDGKQESISTKPGQNPVRVMTSRNHINDATKEYLSQINEYALVSSDSSLKFCKIAEGSADMYPRLAPTMEWDTAAAQAVLEAAGGVIQKIDGTPLQYNKENLLNPYFVAVGDLGLIGGKVNKWQI